MCELSTPNSKNRPENGILLFCFPCDEERRWWLQNCRRENCQPTECFRFCELRFEDSQFKSRRSDGWGKLRPNAVTIIFDNSADIRNLQAESKSLNVKKTLARKEVDPTVPDAKQSESNEDSFSNEDNDFFPKQPTETVMRQNPNVAQWVADHAYVKESVHGTHVWQNCSSPTWVREVNQYEKQTGQEGRQVAEQDYSPGESLRGNVIQRNHGNCNWRGDVLGLRNRFDKGDLSESEESDITGYSSKEKDKNGCQQNCEIDAVGVKSLRGKGSTKYYIRGSSAWKPIREPIVRLTPLPPISNTTESLNFIKPSVGQTYSQRGFRNTALRGRGRGRGRRGGGLGKGLDRKQDNIVVSRPVIHEHTEMKANTGDSDKEERMDVKEQQTELPYIMRQTLPLGRVQRIRGRRGRPRGRGRGRGSVNVFGSKNVSAISSHIGLLKLRFYRRRGRTRGRGRGRGTVNVKEIEIKKEPSVDAENSTVDLNKSEVRLNMKRGGVFVGLIRRGGRIRGRGQVRGRGLELRISERLKDREENIFTDSDAPLCQPRVINIHTSEPNKLAVNVSKNVDVRSNGIARELVERIEHWRRGRQRKRGRGRPRGSGRGGKVQVDLKVVSSENSNESSIFGSDEPLMDSQKKSSLYGEGSKYPCPFCGMAFATHFYMKVHGRLCAMAPGKGAHSCKVCDRLYKNAENLAAHKTKHFM